MILDTECNMGSKEARALIASASGLILDGVDQITHNIKTNEGWEFEVTVKVLKRGGIKEVKEAEE